MEPAVPPSIRFDDGAAYEAQMGEWSRLAGAVFLDWLDLPGGLHWLDIGCGNGAFTELLVKRQAPAVVHGIDPSEGQLAFARTRATAGTVAFAQGDAMALPYRDAQFDVAVMALVVVFLADPPKALRQMVRTLRPGGAAAAYVWDMEGGGFPWEPWLLEMRALGWKPGSPPQPQTSRLPALRALWADAGLHDVQVREIAVTRTYRSFDEVWSSVASSPTVAPALAARSAADIDDLVSRVRARVGASGHEPVVLRARAHAVQGRVPG